MSPVKNFPAGLSRVRCGVRSAISENLSIASSMPTSRAIAGRWRQVLVDPPMAMSTAIAFSKASGVMMSRGRMFRLWSCMIACPARRASATRAP